MTAPAWPARDPQPAPAKPVQPKTAEAVNAVEPAPNDEMVVAVAPEATVAQELPTTRPTGAQGFRAQLQRVAADRLPGQRPLARDITTH